MSRYLDTSTKTHMAKIMVQYGRSSRSFWTESVLSPFSKTVLGKAIRENSIEIRLGPNWESLFVNRERGLFLSVCVDDIKLAGKSRTSDLENSHERRWFGESTSFLDHVYLDWTSRKCQISKDFVNNHTNMFESKISAGATEKLPETRSHGETWCRNKTSFHANFPIKTTEQFFKVATPCINNLKKKKLENSLQFARSEWDGTH